MLDVLFNRYIFFQKQEKKTKDDVKGRQNEKAAAQMKTQEQDVVVGGGRGEATCVTQSESKKSEKQTRTDRTMDNNNS